MMARLARLLVFLVLAGGLFYAGYRMWTPQAAGTVGPATGEKDDDDHNDSVVLSDARIKAAGIELLAAAPALLADTLALNGVVTPNQEALVQVTPRFPGIVKEVRKRVGDRVQKGEVLAIVESNQSLTPYELKAAISGTVIERQTTLGEYASEQKPAFVIADLSTVWVDFSVYRRDINRVHLDDAVAIDPADGGPAIEAKISYLSPVGSADTQSALARAAVANPDQRLRPGLFITGRLRLSAKQAAVAVKSSALQTVENRNVVFVREGDRFEARNVELGERDPQFVEIASGLKEGEVYAAQNSFIVKAEMAKGAADND
jgi:multidrug efflux pump subunit AcrA (membrane-fusion protein)